MAQTTRQDDSDPGKKKSVPANHLLPGLIDERKEIHFCHLSGHLTHGGYFGNSEQPGIHLASTVKSR